MKFAPLITNGKVYLLTFALCLISPLALADAKDSLYFLGSTSVSPLIKAVAPAFKKETGIAISVRALGSSAGIKAAAGVVNKFGQPDIGMSSRPLTEDEIARYNFLDVLLVAKDGLAFVVSADNPIDTISTAQVRDAFLKDGTNWSTLYPKKNFSA